MILKIDWVFFWDQMGIIIIVAACIVLLLITWVIWGKVRNKKIVVEATVGKSKELTDGWTTMYVSRNPVLAWGIRKMDVTFTTDNAQHQEGQVTLRTPVRKAEMLVEGQKGRLCYRGTEFISFTPR